jgi:tetratricopeptide (TPR) repeat protein
MNANMIRHALGVLQDEPDSDQAWHELRSALAVPASALEPAKQDVEANVSSVLSLLEAARRAHAAREEHDAVAMLLEVEASLAAGEESVQRLRELASLRDEVLLDDALAEEAYRRLLDLRPDDAQALASVERRSNERTQWNELLLRTVAQASDSTNPAVKSELLVRAAELELRYAGTAGRANDDSVPASDRGSSKPKRRGKKKNGATSKSNQEPRRDVHERVLSRLRDALALDPTNGRAETLVERVLTADERWIELVEHLESFAGRVDSREVKVAAYARLARVAKAKLGARERAIRAYEHIEELSPGDPEATRALVDHFTESGAWDKLASLYEVRLNHAGNSREDEIATLFQLAMLHWWSRHEPSSAAPYFERLRGHDPTNPRMLDFFREWCSRSEDRSRLVAILSDALRASADEATRNQLAAEIALLSDAPSGAQTAVDQWRSVLRANPDHAEARAALKKLYRAHGAFNQLVDLLRSDLDRVPSDAGGERLEILQELARIYRDHIKSDSALVSVISQIIALDPSDADAVRELARVYEALGRWRDLLATQVRLAELEPRIEAKADLYRSAGRRWLEQFANIPHAVEAFEKLRAVVPDDPEATEQLKVLYAKRRAFRQLYELHEAEAARAKGEERRAAWAAMASLAAERLGRPADATRLYRSILAEDPVDRAALDALEEHAERERDHLVLAEALEQKIVLEDDAAARLGLLEKLGGVYSDRLSDPRSALRIWLRVIDAKPESARALRRVRDSYLALGDFDGLSEFYGRREDWEGLAEVLSNHADHVTDEHAVVDLSYRAAEIFESKLGAPERAVRCYERVLAAAPNEVRAASALVPFYERQEHWARLPALYELLVERTTDDAARRALYDKLARITGGRLSDKHAAFGFARKAYQLSPTSDGAVEAFEATARTSGEWAGFAEAIAERIAAAARGSKESRGLRVKHAETLARHLERRGEAVAEYRRMIEEDPSDDDLVTRLDALLRTMPERRDDLRWLMRWRVDRLEADASAALLTEWAQIEEEAFEDPNAARAVYEELLRLDPTHLPAMQKLASVCLSQGDVGAAVAVLERERDSASGHRRVSLELELARLLVHRLSDPGAALAAAMRAMELSPDDARVVEVLEELLPIAGVRRDVAAVLEASYEATRQFGKQAEALDVLITEASTKQDRVALRIRQSEVRERAGDVRGAFDALAEAALASPNDLGVWDRLTTLSGKLQDPARLVEAMVKVLPLDKPTGLPSFVELELAERIATAYDDQLGEIDRAIPYLDRILLLEPGNPRAFQRLKQILTTRERWKELDVLYERMLASTTAVDRRVDLLAEIALVADEITGDTARATEAYERILELEPEQAQALFALDRLYSAQERWRPLAAVLGKRIAMAPSSAADALRLRLGSIWVTRLGEPAAALEPLEAVLAADPANTEAVELVERCLEEPGLRARAAALLETAYANRGEMASLVRVLEVQLEFATEADATRQLLERIADIRDERLGDEADAFRAYGRLLPLSADANDTRARARFCDLASRLGRESEAASLLEHVASSSNAPQPRVDILTDAAKLLLKLGDAARAETVLRAIVEIAPDDPALALPSARALEAMYAASGKDRPLADMIRLQIALETTSRTRRQLLGRLAKLGESRLSDDTLAIGAWRECLDEDPADVEALAALDRLYEKVGDRRSLIEILRSRERIAAEPEARRAFLDRTAKALVLLGEADEAALTYRAILDDFGPERSVLEALEALYREAGRYVDLVETLEAELSIVLESKERAELFARIGDVRREHLEEFGDALEAYRQALAIEPSESRARAALEAMLRDDRVRIEAAEILRPLYELSGEYDKLVRVLEVQIEDELDLDARHEILRLACGLAERELGDAAAAFRFAARGLRESAQETGSGDWIPRTEEIAERRASGGSGVQEEAALAWRELADLYREVAAALSDEAQRVALWQRVGAVGAGILADRDLAKDAYRAVLDLQPEDAVALRSMDQLYAEDGDHESRLEILSRRLAIASDDAERRTLLLARADVLENDLLRTQDAIETYEQAIEASFDSVAFAGLQRLYSKSERWEELVVLLERELHEVGTSSSRRADLHHELGQVFEAHLNDGERAVAEWARALEVEPDHVVSITALAALLEGHRGHPESLILNVAMLLEAVYERWGEWLQVIATLEARLALCKDATSRRALLARLALLHEEHLGGGAALEVVARLHFEDPRDEATWSELERLAQSSAKSTRLAEVFAEGLAKIGDVDASSTRLALRTAALFEATYASVEPSSPDAVSAAERALAHFQRAQAGMPSQDAFFGIDRALAFLGRTSERVGLYRGLLEASESPDDRIRLLLEVAQLEEEGLGDTDAAISTLGEILSIDDAHGVALDELTRMLTKLQRWEDLKRLLERRVAQSAFIDDESRFRVALAEVLSDRLDQHEAAIVVLERILDGTRGVQPGAGEVFAARTAALGRLDAMLRSERSLERVVPILYRVYLADDNWRKVVELGEARTRLAPSPAEKVAVLRETAKLLEERGGDVASAFDTLAHAVSIAPGDSDTRREIERVAEISRRWDDLVLAFERGIEAAGPVAQRDLLASLATIHDQRRDDPRKALATWGRVLRLANADEAALTGMEQLATLLSDWSALVDVLIARIQASESAAVRASLWRRVAEARRDMLDDAQSAVRAYEQALSLEPDSTFTLDALIELVESTGDASRLVELYGRRVALCDESEGTLAHRLLLQCARCYAETLNDKEGAIDCLEKAREKAPDDAEVLGGLAHLYESEARWSSLMEVLDALGALVVEGPEKSLMHKRIGFLRLERLADFEGALLAFGDVLAVGFDAEVASAVRRIGEENPELGKRAANVLEPSVRAAGRYEDVVAALELRLRGEVARSDRTRTLREIAYVLEVEIGDAQRALASILLAVELTPADQELHSDVERVAARVGHAGWSDYAATLDRVLRGSSTSVHDAELWLKLGRVAEESLVELERATHAYERAAALQGDTLETLAMLERVLVKRDDARAIADVLKRELILESETGRRADLEYRIAMLCLGPLGDEREGLERLRLAVKLAPEDPRMVAALEGLLASPSMYKEAFDILERIFRVSKQGKSLAKLYQDRAERQSERDAKVAAWLELARVCEHEADDRAAAQRAVESAVLVDLSSEQALRELSRLAEVNADWVEAAAVFDRALMEAEVGRFEGAFMASRWCMLSVWYREKLNDLRAAEVALAQALSNQPESVSILRDLEAVQRGEEDAPRRVVTLRLLGRLEDDAEARAASSREAFRLASETLKDRDLSERVLRERLSMEASDTWALSELITLREQAGDTNEVVDRLLDLVNLETDRVAQARHRHRAAELLANTLDDAARAVEVYEAIVGAEPREDVANAALRRLYARLGRHAELVSLLKRLIAAASSLRERSELRFDLASVQLGVFEDTTAGVATLRELVEEDGDHAEAARMLGELYESLGHHEEHALLEQILAERAVNRHDAEAAIAHRLNYARISLERLNDKRRALEAYERVLDAESSHRVALHAAAELAESLEAWASAASALRRLASIGEAEDALVVLLRLADASEKLGDTEGAVEALEQVLKLDGTCEPALGRLEDLYGAARKWKELAMFLEEKADRIARRAESSPGGSVSTRGSVPPPLPRGSVPPASPRVGAPPPLPVAVSSVREQIAVLRRAADLQLHQLSAPHDAIVLLERIVAIAPGDRETMLTLSDAYLSAKRGDDAAAILERMVLAAGAKRTKELAVLHHRLGKIRWALGAKDAAVSQFDLAFKIDPGSIPVLRDLGVLALELGDLDRAQRTFRALLLQRLDAHSGISKGEIFQFLGEISQKQGDIPKAIQMFERAVEHDANLAGARARLGELKGGKG